MKRWAAILGLGLIFVLAFKNLRLMHASVMESLAFCGSCIIPALGPFVVLTKMGRGIMQATLSENPGSGQRRMRYFAAVFLGWIGGFPLGADQVFSQTSENEDVTAVVAVASCAGMGFVVGTVGALLCEDLILGVCLYVFQVFASLAFVGAIKTNVIDGNSIEDYRCAKKENPGLARIIVSATKESVSSVLSICAFVIVFSLVSDMIAILLPFESARAITRAFFEFSSGAQMVVDGLDTVLAHFLLGFTVGFGGLSVHAQILALSEGHRFRYFDFFVFKVLIGLLCGLYTLLYFKWQLFGIVLLIVLILSIGGWAFLKKRVKIKKGVDERQKRCYNVLNERR